MSVPILRQWQHLVALNTVILHLNNLFYLHFILSPSTKFYLIDLASPIKFDIILFRVRTSYRRLINISNHSKGISLRCGEHRADDIARTPPRSGEISIQRFRAKICHRRDTGWLIFAVINGITLQLGGIVLLIFSTTYESARRASDTRGSLGRQTDRLCLSVCLSVRRRVISFDGMSFFT